MTIPAAAMRMLATVRQAAVRFTIVRRGGSAGGLPVSRLRLSDYRYCLLAEDGQREQARQTLALVYDRFTEGFETADLKLARALLEELR